MRGEERGGEGVGGGERGGEGERQRGGEKKREEREGERERAWILTSRQLHRHLRMRREGKRRGGGGAEKWEGRERS